MYLGLQENGPFLFGVGGRCLYTPIMQCPNFLAERDDMFMEIRWVNDGTKAYLLGTIHNIFPLS